MRVAGYEFDCIGEIEPERDAGGGVLQYMPQGRYRNARNLPLNRYGAGPFCRFKIPKSFQASGVYILTINNEVRSVGECLSLAVRFNVGYGNLSPKNCFKGGQETNCRLNNLIYTAAQAKEHVSLWFFQTTDYKSIEAALRSALNPVWNRV
jgi:hypothetical protein